VGSRQPAEAPARTPRPRDRALGAGGDHAIPHTRHDRDRAAQQLGPIELTQRVKRPRIGTPSASPALPPAEDHCRLPRRPNANWMTTRSELLAARRRPLPFRCRSCREPDAVPERCSLTCSRARTCISRRSAVPGLRGKGASAVAFGAFGVVAAATFPRSARSRCKVRRRLISGVPRRHEGESGSRPAGVRRLWSRVGAIALTEQPSRSRRWSAVLASRGEPIIAPSKECRRTQPRSALEYAPRRRVASE
jgi:hypothetical protein